MFDRRQIVIGGALAAAIPGAAMAEVEDKYGLLGKLIAAPGKRDALIGYLGEGAGQMPGNILYVLSTSPTEPDAVWIYEVWETKQHHADSLKLPSVQAAIARARPIIAGFGPERVEMTPVGGVGLG
ncbi:MAG: putative quinol monooxygenase [Caulobacter sp.]|nr:putative quinol monooxygenase [Caulobacter sp.]